MRYSRIASCTNLYCSCREEGERSGGRRGREEWEGGEVDGGVEGREGGGERSGGRRGREEWEGGEVDGGVEGREGGGGS